MRNHPSWYYKQYGEIFGRGSAYERDVATILSVTPLSQRFVQEIGAGTGEHASRLLQHSPANLQLVDDDASAVEMLQRRFASRSDVEVALKDGFEAYGTQQFDVVIVMYSIILQGLKSVDDLPKRVDALISRLRPNGVALFEWIDCDVSQRMYASGSRTVMYERGQDRIEIFSHYQPERLIVNYEGTLNGERIEYRVPMLAVNRALVENMLALATAHRCSFGVVPLEPGERRMLAYIERLPELVE